MRVIVRVEDTPTDMGEVEVMQETVHITSPSESLDKLLVAVVAQIRRAYNVEPK